MSAAAFRIDLAQSTQDLLTVRSLFLAYAAGLDVDLSYQGFAAELADLPGAYAAPRGALLVARDDDATPLGCIGLRPLDGTPNCEMKRLYVAPAGRGRGVGAALVARLVAMATSLGYRAIRLDTLPSMTSAIALYRRLGFEAIEPYYETPVAGTLFFQRLLAR